MTRTKKAKASLPKTSRQSSGFWAKTIRVIRKHKVWAVLFLFLLGYLLFRQIEMCIQKAEFKRAERYVISLAQRMPASPEGVQSNNTCRYTSTKFGAGRRSCSVGATLKHSVRDNNEANVMLKQLSSILPGTLYGPSNKTFFSSEVKQELYQEVNADMGLDCHIQYAYYAAGYNAGFVKESGVLITTVSCSGFALAEYYPVVGM